ncbi:MAG: TetR/AcrR family transcriptional regulator [Sutterellaceae bacterium]|nr:TetR/AcrR family transcriptional regulator [Sutterellaceae bacterium]
MTETKGTTTEQTTERVKQRRLRPDARREAIVTSAAALFVEKGGFDMTMTAIAKALGISRNLVYHYFQNQEALIEAVIDYETLELQRRFKTLPLEPQKEALESVVRTYVEFVIAHAHGLSTMLASAEMRTRLRPYHDRNTMVISELCAQIYGVELNGAYRSALIASVDFMAAFTGTQADYLKAYPETAVKTCVQVFESAMAGAKAISLTKSA